MFNFTVYASNTSGDSKNCIYPNLVQVRDEASFIQAIQYDHVCGKYKNNYRNNDNFEWADVLPQDCDNDHSENPSDWVYPMDVARVFPDCAFLVSYSRNHMQVKNGKAARPKFHVYFPIPKMHDAVAYAQLKQDIQQVFPYFDGGALGASRFLYGTKQPQVELFQGSRNVVDILSHDQFELFEETQGQISEGSRNRTMSHIAGRLIKRYGSNEESYTLFLQEAQQCIPPLSESELKCIWYSATKFGKKIASQPNYISPEEYNESYDDYQPSEFTDIAMAEVFAKHAKDKAVFTVSSGWLYWDGQKWDASELKIMQLYMIVAKRVLKNAGGVFKNAYGNLVKAEMGNDSEKQVKAKSEVNYAKQYLTFAKKMNDHGKVSGVLKLAKSLLEIKNNQLDQDPFILNTPIGVVHLKTGDIKEHLPSYYCTKMTAVAPDSANQELWHQTLDDVTDGDKEFQLFLQCHAGSTLIGKVYEESLLLVYGNGGNGKSTVFNSEAYVLGDYAGKIPAESLTTRAKNVKVDLAELCGKRFILASETEEGQRLSASMLKQIASVDDISAERKYYAPFSFTPSHSTILYTNHLPRVGSNDKGTWRRILVAPFNNEIKNPKTDYVETLLKKAGGAILQWMIDGAKLYIQNHFKYPYCKTVEQAKQVYKDENNWIEHFIRDCCEQDNNETIGSNQLYQAYRQWSISNGEYTRNTRDFSTALSGSGYDKKRTNKGVIWLGLKLNEDTAEFL